MIELKDLTHKYLQSTFQILVIDIDKKIVKSCNSLIDLSGYYMEPAFEVIPFLESVYGTLEFQKVGEVIKLECVNLNFGTLSGVFDIKLHKDIYKDEVVTICMIEDRTELYKYWTQIQQDRNNSLINAELIAKQSAAIKKKNEQIEASINYARHIQNGILPEEKDLRKALPNSFVIFESRDAIGGDFYWMKPYENRVYFGAIDCTGHGVPGALMSMVSASLLEKAVSLNSQITPSEILSRVRSGVINFLSKETNEKTHSDGFDAALLCWDKSTNTIQYSGANNPLVIIRKKGLPLLEARYGSSFSMTKMAYRMSTNEHDLYEIKADKIPVGYYADMLMPFTNLSLQLYPGDLVYSFTDGYKDQLGGTRTKRMGNKQFLNALLEVCHLSPADQKENLMTRFNEWKGIENQVDDVCIMGVRV